MGDKLLVGVMPGQFVVVVMKGSLSSQSPSVKCKEGIRNNHFQCNKYEKALKNIWNWSLLLWPLHPDWTNVPHQLSLLFFVRHPVTDPVIYSMISCNLFQVSSTFSSPATSQRVHPHKVSFHLQIGTLLESPKPLLLLPWPTNCYIALIGRIIISSLVGDNHEQWQKKMNPWTLIERKRKVGHFMNFAYVCNLWTECATHASVVSQKRRKTPSWLALGSTSSIHGMLRYTRYPQLSAEI